MALGFTNVWGFDVNEDSDRWNPLLREVYGVEEKRFLVYDGGILPRPSASVDVVLSQQVLEHVTDELVESYYSEEGRILKPGGIAFHEVPHRFVPFDAHTQTWFIHYLPRVLRGPLYRMTGNDPLWAKKSGGLFVRTPFFHRQMARRHIGEVNDRTSDKLNQVATIPDFDGSAATALVRRALYHLVRTPILGGLLGTVISNLVQLETVTVRRAN